MTRVPPRGRPNRGAAAQAVALRNGPGFVARLVCGAVCLLLLASTGCYSYSVIDPAQADPGLEVRARITSAESARLEDLVGLRDRVIQGQVVDVESAALVLSIPTVLPEPGTSPTRLHRHITLSNSAIVELEQRRLSRWRTFTAVGIAAAVAGYVVVAQFAGDDGDPGTDKPDPNNLVAPIRIPVP